ncbi:hypothetical protein GCM10008018_57080 [Paenibacillus marchantiophytorum]|uniref:Transposase DDE domain-containing protein n=1 Tax=Paenibacillus marchantiophytorum TaxID=1619310 RepID=A0ABQ1F9V3_9BACL|nr:hypothetical protein GCM10008018_57080 [Paenibacillus marchantiophytorum]
MSYVKSNENQIMVYNVANSMVKWALCLFLNMEGLQKWLRLTINLGKVPLEKRIVSSG